MTASELGAAAAKLVRGRRVVVGLSGGVDSVTLTHLLVRGGADVRAAHIDHGLRDDSPSDATFCADIAANLGISYASATIRVRRGNSTQGRARVQRYAALVRLATELGGDLLAVAHHADDAWESSELQRQRGASAVGVAGPSLWSSWHGFDVVRPLLGERRQSIEDAAHELGLRWREDPSNADKRYARTRVRAETAFDANALAERQRAGLELESAASVAPSRRSPVATQFDREVLAALDDQVRARVLLDAARQLHGELPGPLTIELVAAVSDTNLEPRSFCGRCTVVRVDAHAVTIYATRGQGTRLLDARGTPEVVLHETGVWPWFGRTVRITSGLLERTLRGPRPGDELDGKPALQRLAELGVPPADRWCWPCAFDEDHSGIPLKLDDSGNFAVD